MPGDGFAADDVAYSVLPVHGAVHVALVSDGNPFLEKLLRAHPRARVDVIKPARYVDEQSYDALVFDRFAPKGRPHAPALLFLPSPVDWLPVWGKQISNAVATAWDSGHPVLQNVSLLDLRVERATAVDLRGREKPDIALASAAADAPLIVAHEQAPRWISFSFSLEESNFALHSGFPVFLDNALNWMLGAPEIFSRGLGTVEVPMHDASIVAADGRIMPSQSVAKSSVFEVDAPRAVYRRLCRPAPIGRGEPVRAPDYRCQDLGGGLLFASGESVHGERGYSDSAVEKVLPVRFRFEEKRKDLVLVVALDRSYSMKGLKIEMAKEATRAALDLLDERHRFGVVAFDSQPNISVPIQYVHSRREAQDQISRIQGSGQTNIYPALGNVYRLLQRTESKAKHVILLSDGDTHPADFETLVKRMAAEKIVVSTVAVGTDADRTLMSDIATWGKGRALRGRDCRCNPADIYQRNRARGALKSARRIVQARGKNQHCGIPRCRR